MNTIQSIIIAIVEGLTEFLPISSTGHMIITEKLLQLTDNAFTKVFTVAIQLGAILAVVVLYWRKFLKFDNLQFYLKLVAAVIPALSLGFILSDEIDALLESSLTVAISMLGGGIILLYVDEWFKKPLVKSEKQINYKKAIAIGVWQCLAMIPGVSRSAASIIGGMQQKLTRSVAAEFSFFLAVPTMAAATTYKLFQHYRENGGFSKNEIQQLAIGNLVAFVVAMIAIKFFIGLLKRYGFRLWGIYRIIAGIIMLVLIVMGVIE